MTSIDGDNCEVRRHYRWGKPERVSEDSCRHAWGITPPGRIPAKVDWPGDARDSYENARHIVEIFLGRHRPNSEPNPTEKTFSEQVDRWKKETIHLSSISKAISHPSYLRVIGLGKPALPLLIRELQERPDHWFAALEAITGENPVPEHATFDEAVKAWVDWWTQHADESRRTPAPVPQA